MKKTRLLMFVVLFLVLSAGSVLASPEPVQLVETFRKPGVNYSQYKSVGEDVSISIQPKGASYYDNSDPFLRQRLKSLAIQAAKKQGWVPLENHYADVRLAIKVTEWGRFRNSHDQNLMEFIAIEVKAYSIETSELVLRGTGRYSRVDPDDESMEKAGEAFVEIMSSIMDALKTNGK